MSATTTRLPRVGAYVAVSTRGHEEWFAGEVTDQYEDETGFEVNGWAMFDLADVERLKVLA